MDPFTPVMLSQGIIAMIGKGPRSPATVAAIQQHGAVYFAATGGIAALLAGKVITSTLIAFGDLGPEAIYRLEVKNFPLLVAIDSQGNNIYDTKR